MLYFNKYVCFLKIKKLYLVTPREREKTSHFFPSLRKDHCNTYNNKLLVFRLYKEHIQNNKEKLLKNATEKWAKEMKRHFKEKETQMTNTL